MRRRAETTGGNGNAAAVADRERECVCVRERKRERKRREERGERQWRGGGQAAVVAGRVATTDFRDLPDV